MNQHPVTEADLHAYADGLLSQARHAEIAAYLAARPEEQARVGAWRAQNAELHRLFDPVLDEPVPARLSSGLVDRSQRFGSHLSRYAAAVLLALGGGAGGWLLHGAVQPAGMLASKIDDGGVVPVAASAFVRQAAIAHVVYSPDAGRPVEIGADQEEKLVAWLTRRLGTPMRPPHLGALGYELIGGRLLPGDDGQPVAQFMYQDAGGQRLTLYVSNTQEDGGDTGFRFAQKGAVNVFYWIDGRFGYAMSASIDKGTLAHIANVVYEQLEKPH